MPIYEYECASCGKIEEAFQKFSDKPLSKCSHCSGKLHKLISQSAFHLKGSGWYVTDYANKTQKAKASSKQKDSSEKSKEKKASSKAKNSAKKTST